MNKLTLKLQNISKTVKTLKTKDWLKILGIALILAAALYFRLWRIEQTGADIREYEKAVELLVEDKNPYIFTVETFKNLENDPGGKGFAYLPGLLYINWVFYLIHIFTYDYTKLIVLWKIPILLADLGIGILIIKELYKRSYPATLLGLLVWYFSPFIAIKHDYITNDPIPIFFTTLAIYYLQKDSIKSGIAYCLAVACKTFAVFLLPIFLIKTKDKPRFIAAGAILALALSAPFMTSWYDFTTYLQGSVFVHGNRFLQGRPFLFYISYYYDIEIFQIIPLTVYTYLATFSGMIISAILAWFKIIKDKYTLSVIPFLTFYLFTPVLNRTYLIWFLPVFIIGTFNLAYDKQLITKTKGWSRFGFYAIIILYYVFYMWYLAQWKDGFHIWRP